MEEFLMVFEEKMEKTLSNLDEDLSMIRAGRANPALLSKLTVDYYGSASPDLSGGIDYRTGSPDPSDCPLG